MQSLAPVKCAIDRSLPAELSASAVSLQEFRLRADALNQLVDPGSSLSEIPDAGLKTALFQKAEALVEATRPHRPGCVPHDDWHATSARIADARARIDALIAVARERFGVTEFAGPTDPLPQGVQWDAGTEVYPYNFQPHFKYEHYAIIENHGEWWLYNDRGTRMQFPKGADNTRGRDARIDVDDAIRGMIDAHNADVAAESRASELANQKRQRFLRFHQSPGTHSLLHDD